jgi:DNA-binding transcriptional LysR family regulator
MSLADRHLRAFLTTLETRSISKAAAVLGVDNSTLSRMLTRLEAEVGVVLLHRGSHGVTATAAGERYQTEANSILLHMERAANLARSTAGKSGSHIRIGHVGSATLLLPEALRTMRLSQPALTVQLIEEPSYLCLDALARGDLDVALVAASSSHADLAEIVLLQDRLVVALSSHHPLAGRPVVAISDLVDEPIIRVRRAEGPEFYDRVSRYLEETQRPSYGPAQEVVQTSDVLTLVTATLGFALLPSFAVLRYDYPNVSLRDLEPEPPPFTLSIVWRRLDESSEVTSFRDVISTVFRHRTDPRSLTPS